MLETAVCYNLALEDEKREFLRDTTDGSAGIILQVDKVDVRCKLTGERVGRSASVVPGKPKTIEFDSRGADYTTSNEKLRRNRATEKPSSTAFAASSSMQTGAHGGPDFIAHPYTSETGPGHASTSTPPVGSLLVPPAGNPKEPASIGLAPGQTRDPEDRVRGSSAPAAERKKYTYRFGRHLTRLDGKNHFLAMVSTLVKRRVRIDNITPQNANGAEEEYMEAFEQSHGLKRIGARVNLSKLVDPLHQYNGSDSEEENTDGGSAGNSENDFFSSTDGESDADSTKGDGADGVAGGGDCDRKEAKKTAARESTAQAVKAGAAMIGTVVGLLTYLSMGSGRGDLGSLHIFIVCDTQELAGVCHFLSWLRMFSENMRVTRSGSLNILVDVQPCNEHGLATSFEEATKHVVDCLPGTYTSGASFEKRLRIFTSCTKKRLYSLINLFYFYFLRALCCRASRSSNSISLLSLESGVAKSRPWLQEQ